MITEQKILEAAEKYLDEVARANYRRMAERLIRPLESAMKKAFRAQGRQWSRHLPKMRRFFAEAEGEEPAFAHYRFLNTPIKESIPPEEWQRIWADIEMQTVKLFADPIDDAVAKALQYGGAGILAQLDMQASFSLKNPRAVDYLRNYGADQVKGINETTREYLQTIITQATDEGWSYKRTAEAIIDRFEEFAVGKPQAHIETRAHLIAVTEVGNAYEEGNRIVALDLQAAGLPMEKSWSTVGDDKVSEGCLENEADGWIPMDQAHTSGHQRPLRFPGCRCLEQYQIKE